MSSDILQSAIASIRSGDKETGQRLLAEMIRNDPHNESAWLWMSSVIDKRALHALAGHRDAPFYVSHQELIKGTLL